MPSFLTKLAGDPNEKALKKLEPVVEKINNLEPETKNLSDEDLRSKTDEFKKRLKDETPDDILPEAFAVVREMARRTLGQRHFDVQLMGGVVLHQGKIAEMKTGEGKTLASTAPVYLNALTGHGVHLITVNDYLARRDAVWMGQIYHALKLSVSVITSEGAYIYDPEYKLDDKEVSRDAVDVDQESEMDEARDTTGVFKVEDSYLRPVERKEAYQADITYGTNNEFGFDYLRDNLAKKWEEKVQREFSYAIIDEIDSVLIDEARTPLIISAPDTTSSELYQTFARVVPQLKEDTDYNVDYKMRTVSITEEGIDKVEKTLGIENIYDSSAGGGIQYVHALEQALRAHVLFLRDKNYVVKEGNVVIVDEFTGRLMPGRRFSEGLHQALEAKEGVDIQAESRTLASVTFQNFFRMYDKLSGMTGTAITSSEEFDSTYGLEVVVIPTNKPLIRKNMPDLVFRTEEGKWKAVVRDVRERHERGQPVLIGTTSIEKNEYLSKLLEREGIPHKVLNAKNHEKEGEIIAQAGRKGAVTVATNMAGRGVDIILGGNPPDPEEAEEVRKAGGLHVLGTERHEARRIDDQLRGRAGRQGDPGSSQFYVSLEDEIMRAFGGERVQNMMSSFNVPEDQPLESKVVTKSIENAQSKIEGMNFDTRNHVLQYDEVLNKHRETIYEKRDNILAADHGKLRSIMEGYLYSYFDKAAEHHLAAEYEQDWNLEELFEDMRSVLGVGDEVHKKLERLRDENEGRDKKREYIKGCVRNTVNEAYSKREEELGEETTREVERWVILQTIDMLWTDHLDSMTHLRDSVKLRAYAQRDPLVEYKNEAVRMFEELNATIESTVVDLFFKANLQAAPKEMERRENTQPKKEGAVTTNNNQKPRNPEHKNIGRNDPCPCGAINPGTGKPYKYKKCGEINAPHHKG